jgi:prophage regulatory protein
MKYLSFSKLSARLGGRTRSTIYRDLELGRLPMPFKIGHRVYWNETEVEVAVEAHRINPRTYVLK